MSVKVLILIFPFTKGCYSVMLKGNVYCLKCCDFACTCKVLLGIKYMRIVPFTLVLSTQYVIERDGIVDLMNR